MFKIIAGIFYALVALFVVTIIGGMIHVAFFYNPPLTIKSMHSVSKVKDITDLEAVKMCEDEILTRIPNGKQINFDRSTFNIITSTLSGTRVITDSVNYVSDSGINMSGLFNCKVKFYDDAWHTQIFTQVLMHRP